MKKLVLYFLIIGMAFTMAGALVKLNGSNSYEWIFGLALIHQIGLVVSLILWFIRKPTHQSTPPIR